LPPAESNPTVRGHSRRFRSGGKELVAGVLIEANGAPASHHAVRDGGGNYRYLEVGLLLDRQTFPIVNVFAMFSKCGEIENKLVSIPLLP
jgi:hypothetical protein